jgi:hypothetical protein
MMMGIIIFNIIIAWFNVYLSDDILFYEVCYKNAMEEWEFIFASSNKKPEVIN